MVDVRWTLALLLLAPLASGETVTYTADTPDAYPDQERVDVAVDLEATVDWTWLDAELVVGEAGSVDLENEAGLLTLTVDYDLEAQCCPNQRATGSHTESVPTPLGAVDLPPIPLDGGWSLLIHVEGNLQAGVTATGGSIEPDSREWLSYGPQAFLVTPAASSVDVAASTAYVVAITVTAQHTSGYEATSPTWAIDEPGVPEVSRSYHASAADEDDVGAPGVSLPLLALALGLVALRRF